MLGRRCQAQRSAWHRLAGRGLKGGPLKRLFLRTGRVLLPAIALAATALLSGGTGAHAATTAVSSAPCTFAAATSCQSTDAKVTVDIQYSGASACTFAWKVVWGDGSTSDVTVTDPADGYVSLGQHTYAKAGAYDLSAAGQVTAGDCEASPFVGYFTLVKPAPAPSLPGEACVFNAPSGGLRVTVPHTNVHLLVSGHVGWAYLSDPATGTWVFGANEGPVHLYLGSSLTWIGSGKWSYVLSTFENALGVAGKSKTYFHPGNYYKSYRCVAVPAYNSAAALKIAKGQGGESYTIPLSDCLTQTTDVLSKYGAPLNDSTYLLNYLEWVPNTYYASVYMKKFGPVRKI